MRRDDQAAISGENDVAIGVGEETRPLRVDASLLLSYFRSIQRRWRWLAAVTTIVLALTALDVFTATPLYRATAVLQVDTDPPRILPYDGFEGVGQANIWYMDEYIQTEVRNLRSRGLAKRVVDRLGLDTDPRFAKVAKPGILHRGVRPLFGLWSAIWSGPADESQGIGSAAVGLVLSRMDVTRVGGTRHIQISYDAPDSEIARDVANAIAEEFIEQHVEDRFETSGRATEFLRDQVITLKARLEESEGALQRHVERHGFQDFEQTSSMNRERLSERNQNVTEAEKELIDLKLRADAASRARADSFPNVLLNDTIRQLNTRVAGLERELAGISSRAGPEWPRTKELTSQLDVLKKQLTREKVRAIEDARADYERGRRGLAALRSAEVEQQQVIGATGEGAVEYEVLRREIEANQLLYDSLLQRLKEATVAAGLRTTNLLVASPALKPSSPSLPRKWLALKLALLAGILLGAAAALARDYFDSTVLSVNEAEGRLGVPTLATVPYLDAGSPWLGSFMERDDLLPPTRDLEAYRTLRSSLLLTRDLPTPRVILVTSALPGEGKTLTVANLGTVFAMDGAQTAVVDFDLRRPALAKFCGVEAEDGLASWIRGSRPIDVRGWPCPHLENLSIVPAGKPTAEAPQWLGGDSPRAILDVLRSRFDYVIVDAPPALYLSDALLLSRHVDAVLFVIQSGKTRIDAIRGTLAQLDRAGARVVGAVLNQVDLGAPGYGYGSYARYERYYERPDSIAETLQKDSA